MLETSERLLRLLSLLQARPAWPGAELAQRLRVTTRTVRRDVDRLRRLGYPVDSLPGTGGGYRLGAGAALPPLLLDDDEAVAVAVGLRVGTGVAGVEEAALAALAKLDQVLPPRLRHRVTAIAAATVTLRAPAPGIEPEVLATLAQACRSAQRVRTGYTDAHGRATERTLEPHRLVHTGRRWYLVARDVHRDAWRTLRVDRMSAPEITGHTFVLDDPPDAAALVAQAIAVNPYRHAARVRVHADAETLAARVPPTVAMIERLDDATSLLTTGAHDLDSIAVHLALLGFDVDVLDPPELRTRMHTIARRLLAGAKRGDHLSPDDHPAR